MTFNNRIYGTWDKIKFRHLIHHLSTTSVPEEALLKSQLKCNRRVPKQSFSSLRPWTVTGNSHRSSNDHPSPYRKTTTISTHCLGDCTINNATEQKSTKKTETSVSKYVKKPQNLVWSSKSHSKSIDNETRQTSLSEPSKTLIPKAASANSVTADNKSISVVKCPAKSNNVSVKSIKIKEGPKSFSKILPNESKKYNQEHDMKHLSTFMQLVPLPCSDQQQCPKNENSLEKNLNKSSVHVGSAYKAETNLTSNNDKLSHQEIKIKPNPQSAFHQTVNSKKFVNNEDTNSIYRYKERKKEFNNIDKNKSNKGTSLDHLNEEHKNTSNLKQILCGDSSVNSKGMMLESNFVWPPLYSVKSSDKSNQVEKDKANLKNKIQKISKNINVKKKSEESAFSMGRVFNMSHKCSTIVKPISKIKVNQLDTNINQKSSNSKLNLGQKVGTKKKSFIIKPKFSMTAPTQKEKAPPLRRTSSKCLVSKADSIVSNPKYFAIKELTEEKRAKLRSTIKKFMDGEKDQLASKLKDEIKDWKKERDIKRKVDETKTMLRKRISEKTADLRKSRKRVMTMKKKNHSKMLTIPLANSLPKNDLITTARNIKAVSNKREEKATDSKDATVIMLEKYNKKLRKSTNSKFANKTFKEFILEKEMEKTKEKFDLSTIPLMQRNLELELILQNDAEDNTFSKNSLSEQSNTDADKKITRNEDFGNSLINQRQILDIPVSPKKELLKLANSNFGTNSPEIKSSYTSYPSGYMRKPELIIEKILGKKSRNEGLQDYNDASSLQKIANCESYNNQEQNVERNSENSTTLSRGGNTTFNTSSLDTIWKNSNGSTTDGHSTHMHKNEINTCQNQNNEQSNGEQCKKIDVESVEAEQTSDSSIKKHSEKEYNLLYNNEISNSTNLHMCSPNDDRKFNFAETINNFKKSIKSPPENDLLLTEGPTNENINYEEREKQTILSCSKLPVNTIEKNYDLTINDVSTLEANKLHNKDQVTNHNVILASSDRELSEKSPLTKPIQNSEQIVGQNAAKPDAKNTFLEVNQTTPNVDKVITEIKVDADNFIKQINPLINSTAPTTNSDNIYKDNNSPTKSESTVKEKNDKYERCNEVLHPKTSDKSLSKTEDSTIQNFLLRLFNDWPKVENLLKINGITQESLISTDSSDSKIRTVKQNSTSSMKADHSLKQELPVVEYQSTSKTLDGIHENQSPLNLKTYISKLGVFGFFSDILSYLKYYNTNKTTHLDCKSMHGTSAEGLETKNHTETIKEHTKSSTIKDGCVQNKTITKETITDEERIPQKIVKNQDKMHFFFDGKTENCPLKEGNKSEYVSKMMTPKDSKTNSNVVLSRRTTNLVKEEYETIETVNLDGNQEQRKSIVESLKNSSKLSRPSLQSTNGLHTMPKKELGGKSIAGYFLDQIFQKSSKNKLINSESNEIQPTDEVTNVVNLDETRTKNVTDPIKKNSFELSPGRKKTNVHRHHNNTNFNSQSNVDGTRFEEKLVNDTTSSMKLIYPQDPLNNNEIREEITNSGKTKESLLEALKNLCMQYEGITLTESSKINHVRENKENRSQEEPSDDFKIWTLGLKKKYIDTNVAQSKTSNLTNQRKRKNKLNSPLMELPMQKRSRKSFISEMLNPRDRFLSLLQWKEQIKNTGFDNPELFWNEEKEEYHADDFMTYIKNRK